MEPATRGAHNVKMGHRTFQISITNPLSFHLLFTYSASLLKNVHALRCVEHTYVHSGLTFSDSGVLNQTDILVEPPRLGVPACS